MKELTPIIVALVVGLNGLWFWAKFTLKENGYPVSWFWGHFKDIPNMYLLAKRTEESNKKKKYYLVAAGLAAGMIAFIMIIFLGMLE